MQPLVSFVTRTCRRPEYLVENVRSILAQTDDDWEQILLVDNIGRGLLYANGMFAEHQDEVNGEYVYILDDDNMLIDRDVVSCLRKIVAIDNPKVVMCKAQVNDYVTPSPWQQLPFRPGGVDAGCYFVRNDIWKKHIAHFAKELSGDFHFISAVWLEEGTWGFVWWDRLVNVSMRRRPYGETTDRARDGTT